MPDDAPAPPPPAPPLNLSPSSLRAALRAGRLQEVVDFLDRLAPARRAELFVQLRVAEQTAILAAASPPLTASLLEECDSASLGTTLTEIDWSAIAPALPLIPPDNLADVVLHLPEESRPGLIALLEPSLREEVQKLMTFNPESAGGLMTTRYLSVPDVVTIGRAIELLRSSKHQNIPSYVYTVDANGRLSGVAPLRGFLMAPARSPIRSIILKDVVRIKAGAPKEDIFNLFNQHHYVSIPVVDDKDRLIGIVTFDDAMTAQRRREEQVLRGVTGADPREAFKETLTAARGRIPWITVTILGGLACAAIGHFFQRTLSEQLVLGIFVPVVLALGESIGAQTISVVLSALEGGAISRDTAGRFVAKEILIGFLVSVYAGVCVSLASLLWHNDLRMGLLIGGAVFASMVWATSLAVLVPSLMRRLNVNPAIASGPLVLAIADLSALLVYLGGATLMLAAMK